MHKDTAQCIKDEPFGTRSGWSYDFTLLECPTSETSGTTWPPLLAQPSVREASPAFCGASRADDGHQAAL
jgi:hypothetical protein